MIYLDNAATTLRKPPEVAKAVVEAMEHMGNAGRGAYSESLGALRTIYWAREKLSNLFHGFGAMSIAFTANATQSLNTAILGSFKPGDHVITTALEHNSVLRPLYLLQEQGLKLTIVDADKNGKIKIDDIAAAICENTKGVVSTHVSNVTGNVVDIEKIGEICKKNNILFIVDASQSAGILDINMKEMNIDILCFTGHKALLGPQGTGGICVREGITIEPLLVGGSGMDSFSKYHPDKMPTSLEAGTINSHGIAGLLAALNYIEKIGIEELRKREEGLVKQFYQGVFGIPGVTIYGDFSEFPRGAIVSLNIRDYDSASVSDQLFDVYGISTRSGAHCAPLLHEALGTKEQGAVRFSFSSFNTEDEVRTAIEAVKELAKDEER
ncbi:MAG TPA: aminotransferase class V-fold PLP-dependent enzyme [Candidatus Merdenecus merdavium]|nr:aminotransferase class V-fold PLP-dependent enzyme [Candidatus Merdenecus merdavium]